MRRAYVSLLPRRQRQLSFASLSLESSFTRGRGLLCPSQRLAGCLPPYLSSSSSSSVAFSGLRATTGPACVAQRGLSSSSEGGASSRQSETHPFKAETQKLLQIVTHSLYTDKEVFIRELISNAADALEKLRFLQATQPGGPPQQGQLRVVLKADPASKTLTIEDTGIGMTREELLQNLGTIAKSGSLEFLDKAGPEAGKDIIGQFGVGFYSAFVVSERVEVYTHTGDGEVLCWASDGGGSFTVSAQTPEEVALKGARGTRVVCHLKADCAEFANPHRVKECAKKHSAFVNFPVYMEEAGKEELIASQEALWLKSSPTEDEHTQFFRFLTNQSWGEPVYSLMFSADAPLSVRAVLYFPADPPNRLFQQGPLESGVSLHARRVLVRKSAGDLLPKWLWFLKGVVDCEDIPLNVSREHVQDTQLQRKLSNVLVRRILKFLSEQAKADPGKYNSFYAKYSQNIKEGILEDAHSGGTYKDMLLPLLRFECSTTEPGVLMTLEEYVEKMPATQKHIYYYCVSDRQTALASPYMEQFVARQKPVLLMTSEIDEFLAMNLSEYKGKKLVAVDASEEDIESEEGEEAADAAAAAADGQTETRRHKLAPQQQKELAAFIKDSLDSRVTSVKFSDRLVSSPAVVSGFLSPALRRMMKATLQGAAEAQLRMASLPVTLELHPSHEIVTALYHLKTTNPDVAKLLAEQLLDNACVAAGILEEPKAMLSRLNKLLSLTARYAYHHSGGEVTQEAAQQQTQEPSAAAAATPAAAEAATAAPAGEAQMKAE
ncbi:hypothetical protein Efla_002276 [Eimeria flavescens]